jgi:hypothetical protein
MGIQWYSKSIVINEFPTMSKNGLWIENLAELTELLLDDRLLETAYSEVSVASENVRF